MPAVKLRLSEGRPGWGRHEPPGQPQPVRSQYLHRVILELSGIFPDHSVDNRRVLFIEVVHYSPLNSIRRGDAEVCVCSTSLDIAFTRIILVYDFEYS